MCSPKYIKGTCVVFKTHGKEIIGHIVDDPEEICMERTGMREYVYPIWFGYECNRGIAKNPFIKVLESKIIKIYR